MSLPPPDRSGAPASAVFFFAVTLLFTFVLQAPLALTRLGVVAGPPERFLPLVALGAFGPLVGALLTLRREGRPAFASLARGLHPGRSDLSLVLVAPFLLGAIYVAGAAVARLSGVTIPWLLLPERGEHWLALVMFPLVEEPGWRGVALPRLLERFRPFAASLLVGVAWALWHLMMFIVQMPSAGAFALGVANIVAGSLVFGWAHGRSGGNLLVAILIHVGAHLNNPTRTLATSATPMLVYTAALAIVGTALLLLDGRDPTRAAAAGSGAAP